jgi:dihydroorotate dehydrogenase
MNAYTSWIRPLLFAFPPETAHRLTLGGVSLLCRLPGGVGLVRWIAGGRGPAAEPVEVSGLRFPNAVGLAAGLDKDAEAVPAWAAMGFGFVEVGTLTPRPQPGNPRPRLFRLRQDQGLINRMGFNNHGVEAAARRLAKRTPGVVVGGNIGKNKDTPNESAAQDYVACMRVLHPVVDYFTVNISSPNTPGLRSLQALEPLQALLQEVLAERDRLEPRRPVWVKIAPDMTDEELASTARAIVASGADGIVATNTTLSRQNLRMPLEEVEVLGAGGVSGLPVKERSTQAIRVLRAAVGPDFPLIAVGGVFTAADAAEKRQAGANLVQVYTGLIYNGPAVVHDCLRGWNA